MANIHTVVWFFQVYWLDVSKNGRLDMVAQNDHHVMPQNTRAFFEFRRAFHRLCACGM